MEKSGIAVLMCTYNGEKFISEQLNSLLQQDYEEFDIRIYDDSSTDETCSIIKNIIANNDTRKTIKLFENRENSGGAKENFKRALIDNKDYDYVFLCDQDDVWTNNKISMIMERLDDYSFENDLPLLLVHDCELVDKELNKIGYVSAKETSFFDLIFHPSVIGCCSVLNRAALNLIDINNVDFYMHDWFFSLLVSVAGKIVAINECLVKYRQHENNQIGLGKKTIYYKIKKAVFDDEKIQRYSLILVQLYEISKYIELPFLNMYKEYYINKKFNQIRDLFFQNNVFDKGMHGYYQWLVVKKALKKYWK